MGTAATILGCRINRFQVGPFGTGIGKSLKSSLATAFAIASPGAVDDGDELLARMRDIKLVDDYDEDEALMAELRLLRIRVRARGTATRQPSVPPLRRGWTRMWRD